MDLVSEYLELVVQDQVAAVAVGEDEGVDPFEQDGFAGDNVLEVGLTTGWRSASSGESCHELESDAPGGVDVVARGLPGSNGIAGCDRVDDP